MMLALLMALFVVLLGAWPQTAQAASQLLNAELSGRINPATVFDPTPVNGGPAGTFVFTAEFCNVGQLRLRSLTSVTIALAGNNVLLNRAPRTPPGVGSELTFPASQGLVDGLLDPGECVDVDYRIGLAVRAPFQFLVDVVGKVSDPTQPFTFRIDPAIQPSVGTLPGLSGGPSRPVGVTVGPDGDKDEFVMNEVVFHPSSEADLKSFLADYGGVVLSDGTPVLITAAGVSPGPRQSSSGAYIIQVDLSRSTLSDLERNMTAVGITGLYLFSSEDGARLTALLAREAPGRKVSPNMVAEPHCTVCEHPDGMGGFIDAAKFSWLTEDNDPSTPGDQGLSTGVIRAWEYIDYVRPTSPPGGFAPVIIAIIDRGFALDTSTGLPLDGNLDYGSDRPLQVDLLDWRSSTTAGGKNTEIGKEWHGQGAFSVAAALPGNSFGIAGTGGEFVKPMLIKIDGSFAMMALAVKSARLSGAEVINMSWGGECNWWCNTFSYWSGAGDLASALEDAADHGVINVASAGNDGERGDLLPCDFIHVICVGGVATDGTRERKSNFGSNVDIWAPWCVLSTPNPDSANSLVNFCGTSAAAPFVAGIAGLIKGLVEPDMEQVRQALKATANTSATTLGTVADADVTPGWVDALRVLTALRPNQPPTVKITQGLSISSRHPNIEADVLDPEPGGARPGGMAVRFSSDRDGELCVDHTFPFSCGAGLSAGTHVITATATDSFGGQGSASLTLLIKNALPTATITSPSLAHDIDVFSSQFVKLQGRGEDADGPVTVKWELFDSLDLSQGVLLGTDNNIIVQLPVGTHIVAFTVTDADGATARQQFFAAVVPGGGGLPTALIEKPLDGATIVPGSVTFFQAGHGTDPEDGVLPPSAFRWSSDLDGFLGTGANIVKVLSQAITCEGHRRHTITLEVTDSDGNVARDQIVVDVNIIC